MVSKYDDDTPMLEPHSTNAELATAPPKSSKWFKPRLDWLLVFVPIAMVLRFAPGLENPTALFIVSCLAIIPLASWMGRRPNISRNTWAKAYLSI